MSLQAAPLRTSQLHEDSRISGESTVRQGRVAIPRGIVAKTPDEAAAAFTQLGGPLAVVKSQVHAGGRGKGTFKEHPQQRGVVLVKTAEDAKANAARMLGSTLVTIQTGDAGKQVNTLFVEQGLEIDRELYLGSSSTARPVPLRDLLL